MCGPPDGDQQFHDSCPQSLFLMSRPLSWTECILFSVILFPNLFLELPVQEFLILCFLAIPFRKKPRTCGIPTNVIVLFILPLQLIYDRYSTSDDWTFFQNLVLRCVRFAFANLSATGGRVLFSERQAFPFNRYRTHGKAWTWRTKVTTNF
jgi:hypothetical protein